MCRMLSIVSRNTISTDILKYYVFDSERSIIKQSRFNPERLQRDGWGIAYYKKRPVVFKSPNPVYDEKEILEEKISDISSNFFLIHIRNASNPNKLDRDKLIGYENTQPFLSNSYIFSHNGTLSIVNDVFENLGRYKKYVKGVNDSEVLFWHFIKHMDAYGDPKTSLYMMRDEINTIWISVKKDYKKLKKPYNGLNVFVYDGNKFFALCDFKMDKEIYSIMTPKWEYGSYAFMKNENYIVISSEPCDGKKWNKIDPVSIITIDTKSLKIMIEKIT
jgi:predicted glutamine amidotransferase